MEVHHWTSERNQGSPFHTQDHVDVGKTHKQFPCRGLLKAGGGSEHSLNRLQVVHCSCVNKGLSWKNWRVWMFDLRRYLQWPEMALKSSLLSLTIWDIQSTSRKTPQTHTKPPHVCEVLSSPFFQHKSLYLLTFLPPRSLYPILCPQVPRPTFWGASRII